MQCCNSQCIEMEQWVCWVEKLMQPRLECIHCAVAPSSGLNDVLLLLLVLQVFQTTEENFAFQHPEVSGFKAQYYRLNDLREHQNHFEGRSRDSLLDEHKC